MRNTLVLALLFLGGSQALHAQSDTTMRKIDGTVKSAKDGTVVPFATVKIKGASRGTITDENGKFQILAKSSDTLVLSAVGFHKLESACKTSLLTLALPVDQRTINEVMIIGYGNERKRNITGSIASIDAKELSKSPALSFDNAIIGKAAGVNIMSSSGVPGSATAITIRGLSSLNPDGNQPLIVIDGIPVYGSGKDLNNRNFNSSTTAAIGIGGGTSVADNYTPPQDFENNPLSALNPADIESIEILKDAYATAIYGSMASAGVILVTTKRGKKGAESFNVRMITGTVQPIGKYKLLNGAQYNDVYTQYYHELGQNYTFNEQSNTDWVDEITRTAISQQVDASLSAGGEKAFSTSFPSTGPFRGR